MILVLARTAFLALLVTLPLVRVFEFRLSGYPLPITDFIFPLCAILWLGALAKREIRPRWDQFFNYLLAYFFMLALSAVLSLDRTTSFTKLAGEAYLFSLCFLAFQLFADVDFRSPAIKAWLAGTALCFVGVAAGVVMFYLGWKTQAENGFLSHFGSLPAADYPRLRSTFANANMMANFMNVSLMLALLAGRLGIVKAITAKIAAAAVCLATVLTLSPGLGGLALSTGIWLRRDLLSQSRLRAARIVLAISVATAGVVFLATLASPDTANTDRGITVLNRTIEPSVRVLVWESALQTVAEHPLLGRGVGIDPAFVRYTALSGDQQTLRDAHNIPLNVAGQSGLIGLSVFSLMMIYLARFIGKYSRHDDTVFALSLAFIGAFFYQGLTGSFEDARHIWILVGFLVASRPGEA